MKYFVNKSFSLYLSILLIICNNAFCQQPDLRGPIQSNQFQAIHTKNGIFATKFHYNYSSNSKIDAPWIWLDSKLYPDQQSTQAQWIGQRKEGIAYVANFKKLLKINEDVNFAEIKISADIQYRLFVNGKLIQRGPANIGSDYEDHVSPQHWYFDEFSIKTAFKKGVNVIAVEVSTLSRTASSTTSGHAGLIINADLHLKSGRDLVLKTDSTWLCKPSRAYGSNFEFDASSESQSWIYTEGKQSTWSKAVILPDSIMSKWKLKQSELPQMMEARINPVSVWKINSPVDTVVSSFPIKIKKSSELQHFRIVFDNLYTGYVGFKIEATSNAKLKIIVRETSDGGIDHEMNYITATGLQSYEFPNLIDGKYMDLEIFNPGGDLQVSDIAINSSGFPVTYSGSFSCSDTSFNAIWRNIRWVTQMNMQTYHMDSPLHQEPVCDAGDYLIESMVNYYAFSSPLLIKQDLRKIALVFAKTNFKMFHTSYMLLWEQMLINYCEYSGDKELLKELAPVVYKLISQFQSYKGEQGLISEAPNYMFMDWGGINGVSLHHPPPSWGQGYMTALYYKALTDAAKMASYLKDSKQYETLNAEAAIVKRDFNYNLFDPSTGLYKNGLLKPTKIRPYQWLPKDTLLKQSLPYVNTLAVAYDLAPPNKISGIIDYVIKEKNVPMSPYFMYFVFEALNSAGLFDKYGISQLRRWNKVSNYPVGLRENWESGDYSHAWGGSAAYALSANVLGIKPGKSGFSSVLISPSPGELKWAKGTMQTNVGKLSVDWTNTEKRFKIQSNTPARAPITFLLPLYKSDNICINGKKWRINRKNERLKNVAVSKVEHDRIMVETLGGINKIIIIKARSN